LSEILSPGCTTTRRPTDAARYAAATPGHCGRVCDPGCRFKEMPPEVSLADMNVGKVLTAVATVATVLS
jgi:hypothetical protein